MKNPEMQYGRITDENGAVVYIGETCFGKPYGQGTAYRPGGTILQEGTFGVKGLIEGTVFYPDGKPHFRGKLTVNRGYGPNFPEEGTLYDEQGNTVFEGKFSVARSGIGYPFVNDPEAFGPVGSLLKVPFRVFGFEDERKLWEEEQKEEKKV